MLESLHLPYLAARDGSEALEITGRANVSLVLMDLQMPGMDGYEATRAIRRAAQREHLPIVAMTAHVGFENQRRCHEVGCVDFLGKPIEQRELKRILRRWIRAQSGDGPSEDERHRAKERPFMR